MHTPRPLSSRRWLAGGLCLLILALVVLAGYWRQSTPPPPGPPAPRVPRLSSSARTLVPGLYYLGGLSPAAAYVVDTSEGLVLIDAGLDREALPLRQQMATLGLDWRRLRAIFLTHVHGDHCGGAEFLRAQTGAKVHAGRGDAAILRAGRPREAFFSTFPMPPELTPGPTTVDVELSADQGITIGEARFQTLDSPGHTPGSICYLLDRGGQRVLFSGDVIWSLSPRRQGHSPNARPLGTYAAYLPPRYRGNAADFLATLRRLRQLPAPDLVLPGHPHNDVEPQSPAMTQPLWEELLDPGIAEMEQLVAHYARDGTSFLDGGPKKLLPGLYYLGDHKDVAVYAVETPTQLVLVNAPGPGLDAFLRRQLKQLGVKSTQPATVLLTSGDPQETAGLAELLGKHPCRVVASGAAWSTVKKGCPVGTSFLSADELAGKSWLSVETIALAGRGVGSVAYRIHWEGKTLLITGRIPVKLNAPAFEKLRWDLGQARENGREYRRSLRRLAAVKPDLWLPAFPSDGQNANLYQGDWEEVLSDNERMLGPSGLAP